MKCKTKLKYIAKMVFKYITAISVFVFIWSLFCAFIETIEIGKCYIMSFGIIAYAISSLVYESTKTMIQDKLKIKDDYDEM